jgi:hypothetical protein
MSEPAPSIQQVLGRMRVSTGEVPPAGRAPPPARDELARTWSICRARGTNDGQQVPYGRRAALAARAML